MSWVERLRVKVVWQQYNPTFGRWNTTLQKTFESARIPLTSQSHWYRTPFHRFGPFTGEGRLVVKITGVRNVLRDLNHTQVVAYCQTRAIGGG